MNLNTFFDNYCENYKSLYPESEPAFDLKKIHSAKVALEAENISSLLKLKKEDIKFSYFTGLFHDMGRFPQFAQYKTFNDSISEDHGKLSVKEVIKTGVINEFKGDYKKIFISSLFFHNKKSLPLSAIKPESDFDKRKALFLKIIRDADKIDILRVMDERYKNREPGKEFIEMGLSDSDDYSKSIIKDIKNQKPASIKDVKTITDLKLLQLSWIFDINFNISLEIIKKRGLLENLYSSIQNKPVYDFCSSFIENYFRKKLI